MDLTAGRCLIVGDVVRRFDPVGEAATPDRGIRLAADGAVRLAEDGVAFPDALAPGRRVWEITTDGAAPHELLLAWSPEPLTAALIVGVLADGSVPPCPAGVVGTSRHLTAREGDFAGLAGRSSFA